MSMTNGEDCFVEALVEAFGLEDFVETAFRGQDNHETKMFFEP